MNDKAKDLIKKEYFEIKDEPFLSLGISVGLKEENNYFRWRILMFAPDDSIYKDGIFQLSIDFNEYYPQQKPIVKFNTKICHWYVSDEGDINIPSLKNWNANNSMRQVLSEIFALFYEPDINSKIETEIGRNNYKKKVEDWVSKFAK